MAKAHDCSPLKFHIQGEQLCLHHMPGSLPRLIVTMLKDKLGRQHDSPTLSTNVSDLAPQAMAIKAAPRMTNT